LTQAGLERAFGPIAEPCSYAKPSHLSIACGKWMIG
jgi:hypothetical protein